LADANNLEVRYIRGWKHGTRDRVMAKKRDKSTEKPGNKITAMPLVATAAEKVGAAPESGKHKGTAVAPVPLPAYESPEQFATNMLRAFELSGEIVRKLVADREKRDGAFTVIGGLADAPKLFAPIAHYWMSDPQKLAAAQAKLSHDLIDLWGRTYKRFLGQKVQPVVKHSSADPRFQDKEWTENAFFDFLRQAYLITGRWAQEMVENAATVDQHTKHRAEFYLNQIVSALSPSNFPFTNPEVIRATFATGGQNLAKGLAQLLEDMQQSGELLRIRQTDMSAFEVGKNLAITPGKIIYQNEVMQLIQYSPTTETVYEIPLLIVPPWINKFYILDLTPPKSFVKWVVDQGFTVFVVSWVNPDESLAGKTFEDYMREGVFDAAGKVLKITGAPQANALGYCVGGTLLASSLAYMAAKGDNRIRSATFLAAQKDFSNAGDLLVFIDDEQLKALDEVMNKRGYLDGARMSSVFNMLRPKDLVWPYIVNNYLLGKQPFPFDLLYWNSDSTRMPPANHSFYLREFYRYNKLSQGLLKLAGVQLDLSRVEIPIYELATKEDHIAPAQSVLIGARLFGGPVRYVLAGSGHIAGVINPPHKPKYMHWILEEGDVKSLPTVEAFLSKAKEYAGSWWPDYQKWLAGQSGEHVPAREPGGGVLEPIEDAPGSYVKA
jgi:polyhydroxyalkanoate synthase subunit PhaC